MPLHITWQAIALRIFLAMVAGTAIGMNRDEHARPAGMRTTILVCLAAALAMIQMNLLLPTAGRPGNSFIMNDLMRLPLGILTGIGFIGAGAIVRRDSMVRGVTTAATLWIATVIGLLLGGGQLWTGMVGAALTLITLSWMRKVEYVMKHMHRGALALTFADAAPSESDMRKQLERAKYTISSSAVRYSNQPPGVRMEFHMTWYARGKDTVPPPIVAELGQRNDMATVDFQPE